jgi:hypothetical protein
LLRLLCAAWPSGHDDGDNHHSEGNEHVRRPVSAEFAVHAHLGIDSAQNVALARGFVNFPVEIAPLGAMV